jgi:hypothetical protein
MTPAQKSAPRWREIADNYATTFGRKVKPTEIADYAMQIMSLLSDAQHQDSEITVEANDSINAAKMMLSDMIIAAREAERAGKIICPECGDAHEDANNG